MEPFIEAVCDNVQRPWERRMVFLKITDLICFCHLICRHKIISKCAPKLITYLE